MSLIVFSQLSKLTKEVNFEELLTFFEDVWAPTIKDCHCRSTGATFELLINDLCRGLKEMELKEVFIIITNVCLPHFSLKNLYVLHLQPLNLKEISLQCQ